MPPDEQKRYMGLLDLWLNPKGYKTLTKRQESALEDKGLLRESAGVINGKVGSVAATAKLIAEHFKCKCSHNRINQYLKGLGGLDRAAYTAIPKKNGDFKWEVQEWFSWWERWILKNSNLVEMDADEADKALTERLERAARRVAAEKELGNTLDKNLVVAEVAGICTKFVSLWDRMIEDKPGLRQELAEILRAMGEPEEKVLRIDTEFAARAIKCNSGLKAECREAFAKAQAEMMATKKK